MDIPVCFTLVHKGCGITPPIYSALLRGVWYWCTRGSRWCVLCRTLGNNLPRFALPYQIAPASLASSWAGRHCLSHADSTLKCCQGMLSHLLSPTTSPKSGCLLKHPCLPSCSKNPAVPVPHIFVHAWTLLPRSCGAWKFPSHPVPPALCRWWLAHLRMHSGTKQGFSDAIAFQIRSIRTGWKEVIQTIGEPRPHW